MSYVYFLSIYFCLYSLAMNTPLKIGKHYIKPFRPNLFLSREEGLIMHSGFFPTYLLEFAFFFKFTYNNIYSF